MKSKISFTEHPLESSFDLGPFKIRSLRLHHPDKNCGYRIEADNGSFVFLSDTEITQLKAVQLEKYAEFCRGADIVYADCQYDFVGAWQKVDFGHSTVFSWIDLLKDCGIGTLLCAHFDPASTDDTIETLPDKIEKYLKVMGRGNIKEVIPAYEGYKAKLMR